MHPPDEDFQYEAKRLPIETLKWFEGHNSINS